MYKNLISKIPYSDTIFFGNSVENYILSIILFFIIYFGLFFGIKILLLNFIKNFSRENKKKSLLKLANRLAKLFNFIFFVSVSLLVSLRYLSFSVQSNNVINGLLIVITTFYGIQILKEFLIYIIDHWKNEQQKVEGQNFDPSVFNLLQLISTIVLWLAGIIFILQNFGLNVTTLVGGLGITGIAVAFALQNLLADIFASFSIYLDKPFKAGDFIIVGTDKGHVQKVGIATTRIKTLQGQELILNNTELVKSRVNNFQKMKKRRDEIRIGLEYSTSSQKLKKIPNIIKKIVSEIENCEFERAHFKEFGEFSLIFEIVYFINNSDYNLFMDVRQQINLQIKEAFEKEKINMAFPTQKIEIIK